MENKKIDGQFNYVDSGNISHSIDVKKEDFDLVQVDKSLHDTKFKSKPTTFFKDALKRFSKNKASVAGAIILGTLLVCSVAIPLIDRNPVDGDRSVEQFLPPKLFPSGTGFWDGTVQYQNKIADPSRIGTNKNNKDTFGKVLPGSFTSEVANTTFNEAYISKLSDPVEGTTNSPSIYGTGGQLVIKSQKVNKSDETYIDTHNVKYMSPKQSFNFEEHNYTIDVKYNETFEEENYKKAKYNVTLEYKEVENSPLNEEKLVLIEDTDKSASVNLNDKITAAGLTTKDLVNSYISINVVPSAEHAVVAAFDKLTTKVDGKVDEALSIEDPCKKLAILRKDKFNYWSSYSLGNGTKELQNAKCSFVSFTYDAYDDLYGLTTDYAVPETTVKQYIKEGKLPEDFYTNKKDYLGKNLYEMGYDDTPIVKLERYSASSSDAGISYTFRCTVYKYKLLGYNNMPIFLFGTNQQGFDVLKIVFIGLRTSLLLGILVTIINFTFGLCYGAIAGYFGGTVDLVMQRFTDILSGVPWIVIMTLMILNFGQSFWVFAAALCLTGWIGTAGLTRTQFYRFRGREYILASRTLGANDARLIFRHILPNSMGTIITSSVLMIPSVIFSEASISYLGLGLKGMNSLGVILSDNQKFLQDYPYLLVVPAVVIALIMISFNLFGNGLRDAFNPSLKGSE